MEAVKVQNDFSKGAMWRNIMSQAIPLTIAQAVGIPSVSSFNRNFQQVMGMSPRQYRASTARPGPLKSSILPYRGWTLPEN